MSGSEDPETLLMLGCPPSPAVWPVPPLLTHRLISLRDPTHRPHFTRRLCPPTPIPHPHQETVIVIPHEDQAQPGHHLQVAAAELNEDPRLAEGQLNPVEERRDKVLGGGARRQESPGDKIPAAMCVTETRDLECQYEGAEGAARAWGGECLFSFSLESGVLPITPVSPTDPLTTQHLHPPSNTAPDSRVVID